MLLTVFTPTYNRARLLGRVYRSLCEQSCQDFEWLVIDDGSTDGTGELVKGWISEGRIRIRYHWKENGGLYTGYNAAYELAQGELCVCIDSDDWMPANAVEIIKSTWEKAHVKFVKNEEKDLSDLTNLTCKRGNVKCVKNGEKDLSDLTNLTWEKAHVKFVKNEEKDLSDLTNLTCKRGNVKCVKNGEKDLSNFTNLTWEKAHVKGVKNGKKDLSDLTNLTCKRSNVKGVKNGKKDLSNLTNLTWENEYAGMVGLDFDARTGKPIGGWFPEGLKEVYFYDIHLRGLHRGDTKEVLRTDLMRQFVPMVGFEGERNFNPVYLMLQATERLPLIVVNRNLCNVEYQEPGESMSANIFGQYVNSPRSFAKLRCLEIGYSRNNWRNRLRCYAHLASHCIMAHDYSFRHQVPNKLLFWASMPMGWVIYRYVKGKTKR